MSECRGPGCTHPGCNGDRADSTSPDDLNRPVVKYDGNGQPMRADDPRLGNRAQRRAMAREARRRR